MSFGFKIKRSAADKAFSDWVRLKNGWNCERCLRNFEDNKQILHLSHFIGRGNKTVRWDEENAASLCFSCHKRFTENAHEHSEFFLKKLGKKAYDALVFRSHLSFKALRLDQELLKIYYQTKIKEFNKSQRGEVI